MVAQILKLSDPVATNGGAAIEFTMETTDGNARLTIPATDLPLFVQFFAGIASYTDNDGMPSREIAPIMVSGLGVAESETPGMINLVVKVGGATLAFECPRNELIDTGRRLQLAASTPISGSKLN